MARHELRQIVCRRFIQEAGAGPTIARWQSHGWTVQWWGDVEEFDSRRDEIMTPRRR